MNKTWVQAHMRAALEYANTSKCAAKKVAALIVKDNAVISIGINGTLSGRKNCCNLFKKEDGIWYYKVDKEWLEVQPDAHSQWSALNEVHAETNAISKAAKNGISTNGATMFVTYSPCINCAKSIVTSGIIKVFYLNDYDDIINVKAFLRGKVELVKVTLE